MDGVVAPLLHDNEPVNPDAVNTELPQLLPTATIGTATVPVGAAVPLPDTLVQALIVWVTVYVPAADTVMDEVVAPLLHNKDPVVAVAVNTEPPQLFTTVTVGGTGIVFGADVPLPAALVQPFKVCVTL
jgi:hypothetical protein